MANAKISTKQAAGKKTVKKAVKPAVKKPVKPAVKKAPLRASATVVAITPSSDGTRWTMSLSDKRRVRVSAAAAQAARARVGMRWTDATDAKVAAADASQRAFTRAMALLVKRPTPDRATLERLLGGDRAARETVRALAANGWIERAPSDGPPRGQGSRGSKA